MACRIFAARAEPNAAKIRHAATNAQIQPEPERFFVCAITGLEAAGVGVAGHDGQAGAVDRDAFAKSQLGGERRRHHQGAAVALRLDTLDGGQSFDESGEHDGVRRSKSRLRRSNPSYAASG